MCSSDLLFFLSHEVVASVITSLYLFIWFFVPSLASNALKVRGVVLLSRNIILSFTVQKSKISEFYLFLVFLDSKPDTFIYLSLVLTFLI